MKKELIISLFLVGLLFIVGCEVGDYKIQVTKLSQDENDSNNLREKVITNFEDLDLSLYVGQNITIKGKAIQFPLFTTQNYKDDFYGLRDKNGFHIKFIARGNRNIELGEQYTIKGTVIEEEEHEVWCMTGGCETYYFLKEVKP